MTFNGARPVIALVSPGIHDRGGTERVTAELVRHAHNHIDFVFVADDIDEDIRPLGRWIRTPAPVRPAAARFSTFYRRSAARLRRERVDLVHTVGVCTATPADLITMHFCHTGYAEKAGRRYPDGARLARRANTALYRTIAMRAERRAFSGRTRPVAAAVSTGLGTELKTVFPTLDVRITPNGVDTVRFRPDSVRRQLMRRRLGVSESTCLALFVGGDWDRKGLGVAIDALPLVTQYDVQLVVVGAGAVEDYTARSAALGQRERVVFAGVQNETENYYSAADVFIFPSEYEAAPLVLLEAAASGLPIIATPVSGAEGFLGDDAGGIAVERDPRSVADALASLAMDPGRRHRLGALARHNLHVISWQASAASTCELYSELVKGRRGRS